MRIAKFVGASILSAFVLLSCGERDRWSAQARRIVSTLSPEALVGQVIMTGLPGSAGPANDAKAIVSAILPGGAVLFGFNAAGGPEALRRYTAALQEALPTGHPPILFAIDHEGGSVWRFGSELSRLPSPAAAGEALDRKGMEALGGIAGRELAALGIGLSLGPVVEPLSPLNAAFMSLRCFSDEPDRAATLAASFARGLEARGVGACYKHYPASAAADPHKGPSVLSASAAELERWGLSPFRRALKAKRPTAVMLSHAVVKPLDPERPASLSPAVISGLKGMGFRGIVLTDDLLMAGAQGNGGSDQAALDALEAGADMVMISSPRDARAAARFLLAALEDGRLDRKRLEDACLRIVSAKLALRLERESDPAFRASSLDGFGDMVSSGRYFIKEAMRKTGN